MARGEVVGSIAVRVVPDMTGFVARLRTTLARVEKTQRVHIDVDVDTDRAQTSVSALAMRIRGLQEVGGALAGPARLGAMVAGIGSLGVAAVGSLGGVGALAGVLANLSGVGAALPAMLAGVGAGAAVVKMAFASATPALEAQAEALAGGAEEAKAYREELAKLPPGTRKFVEALMPARRALGDMKETIGNNFFGRFAGSLGELAPNLGIVRRGLERIATAVGDLAKEGVEMLASGPWSQAATRLMQSAGIQVVNYGDGLLWAVDSVRILAVAGAPLAEQLSRMVLLFSENVNGALRAAEANGTLAAFMDRAAQALDSVLRIAGSVGRILVGVFNSGQESGQRLLDTIAGMLDQLANVTGSVDGQAALGEFFERGAVFVEGLLATIGALLPALLPLLDVASQLAERIGRWAQENPKLAALGLVLVAVGVAIANLLPGLAAFVTGLVGLTKVQLIVYGIAAAIAVVAGGFATLMAVSAPLRATVVGFARDAWAVLQQLGAVVRDILQPAMARAATVIRDDVAPAVNTAVQGFRDQLLPALQSLVGVLERNKEEFAAALDVIVRVAGWIISNLVPVLIRFYADVLVKVIARVIMFVEVMGTVIRVAQRVWAAIQLAGSIISKTWQLVQARTAQLRAQITAALQPVINLASRVRSAYQNAGGGISGAMALIRTAASKMASVVKGKIAELIGNLRGIPGRARSAVGSLAGTLTSAGRNLIQGLINGVAGKLGSLRSKLGEVTRLIPQWKGPPGKDAKLLYPAGRLIMGGLIGGLGSLLGSLNGQLGKVTDAISGRVNAARELLGALRGGKTLFEDLSFRGMSGTLGQFNDDLADAFYKANPGADFNDRSTRGRLERFLGGLIRGSQAPASAPARAAVPAGPLVGTYAPTFQVEALADLDELVATLRKLSREDLEQLVRRLAEGR
jgi:phage-related protein